MAWSFSNSDTFLALGFLFVFVWCLFCYVVGLVGFFFFFQAAMTHDQHQHASYTSSAGTLYKHIVLYFGKQSSMRAQLLSVKYPHKKPPTNRLAINHEVHCAEAFWMSLKKHICSVHSHEMMPQYSLSRRGAPFILQLCSKLFSLPYTLMWSILRAARWPGCTSAMFLYLCSLRGPWNLLSHINGSYFMGQDLISLMWSMH